MFQNAVIDVAIGLVLMYLILSLLCTVINEYIATKLRLRSKSLASALEKLLDNESLRNTFYKHGLIVTNKQATATGPQSTMSGVVSIGKFTSGTARNLLNLQPAASPDPQAAPSPHKDHPSYISSRSVALALIGSLDTTKPLPVFQDIKDSVEKLPKSHIRDALLSSMTAAGGDLDKLRTGIASWFDDSMERLSGAYKRQLKWISMLTGLIVAIAFNADSLKVVTTLWHDPGRRAAVIEMATTVAKKSDTEVPKSGDETNLENAINKAESTLLPLPVGWHFTPEEVSQGYWECVKMKLQALTLTQILGWLLTAAALSLGAPFWFDLLQKFVNIRGAGGRPKREDEKQPA